MGEKENMMLESYVIESQLAEKGKNFNGKMIVFEQFEIKIDELFL